MVDRRTRARMVLYPLLLVVLFASYQVSNLFLQTVISAPAAKPDPVFMINSAEDLDSFYSQSQQMTDSATDIGELVLVTGGSGFIGSHLVDLLLSEGYQVIVFDRVKENEVNRQYWKMKGKDGEIPAFLHVYGDINNKDDLKLIPDFPYSYVVHLAGEAPVWDYQAGNKTDTAEEAQGLNDLHVGGTKNLWELIESRDHPLPRFVAISTTDIYGPLDKTFLPYSKKRAPNPMNEWAKSKLKMERFLQKEWRKKPTNIKSVTIVRPTTVYGPRQLSHEGLVSHLVREGLRGNPLPLPGVQHVHHTRDFIYVGDLAKSMLNVMKDTKARFLETNVGSGQEASLRTLAEWVFRDTQGSAPEAEDLVFLEREGGDYYCDVTNQRVDEKRELFLPENPVMLEEGLKRTVEDVRGQMVRDGEAVEGDNKGWEARQFRAFEFLSV